DAPARQRQGEMPLAVLALDPAEAIAVVFEPERPRGLEPKACALFHLRDHVLEAQVVDGVLEARVLALDPVAVVALYADRGAGDVEYALGRDEADHAGQARVGLRVAVAGAHAAADGDVEAGQVAG